jgi:McrBC 5-methylcytosine restriction system component
MWITDNTSFKGEAVQTIKNTYPKLLNKLSNNTLENLAQSSNLLLFPNDISESGDLDKDAMIVKTYNGTIQFQNVIGFIGYGQERLNIHSRFSTEGMGDNFLHYMLKRVLNINVTNLETDTSNKLELYDLLRYIFPSYLNAALKKGVLRQYQRFEYNDASIKGTIDIARHIKQNTPFTGKVAYSTREYTGDNNVMELIRHTIEYIQSSSRNGNQILNSSDEVRHNVAAVIRSTPSYSIGKRQKVIIKNRLTPVRHAFYTEYRDLQRLCLMILRHQKIISVMGMIKRFTELSLMLLGCGKSI